MPEILNSGIYNLQGDITTVKAVGMDTVTNELGLYSITIPIKDAVSGFPKERLLGRMKENTNIFDIKGDLTGITTQNTSIPTFEGSVTITDNSVFEVDKTLAEGYRNVLEGLMLCETIIPTNGGNPVKILGIGGNVITPAGTLQNKDWKWFFDRDNKLIKAYTGSLTTNVFLGAYNRSSQCVALEMQCTSNSEETQTLRYGAILAGNNSMSEGDDKNTSTIDIKFLSDFRTYEQPIEYGIGINSDDLTTVTEVIRADVDYIVAGSGLTAPSDFGTNGDIAVTIDTDNGSAVVAISDGSSAWTPVTGTVLAGATFFSTKINTSSDTIAGAVDGHNLVSAKVGGASGAFTASGTTVTSTATYACGTTYTLPMYAFNFSDGEFRLVETASDL